MKDAYRQSGWRLALAAGLFVTALAGAAITGTVAQAAEPEAAGFPVYKPPLRGTPVARMGGGTRGEDEDAPEVYVLTPEHTGLTSQAQPVMYWYL